MNNAVLTFHPPELTIKDIQYGQTYTYNFTVTNNVKAGVEVVSIRSSASDRIVVEPSSFRLKAQESIVCTLKLRVLRYANKAKAVEHGQKDVLQVKGTFFDQKLYCVWFLHPDAQELTGKPTFIPKDAQRYSATVTRDTSPPVSPRANSPTQQRHGKPPRPPSGAIAALLRKSTGSIPTLGQGRQPGPSAAADDMQIHNHYTTNLALNTARKMSEQEEEDSVASAVPTLAPESPASSLHTGSSSSGSSSNQAPRQRNTLNIQPLPRTASGSLLLNVNSTGGRSTGSGSDSFSFRPSIKPHAHSDTEGSASSAPTPQIGMKKDTNLHQKAKATVTSPRKISVEELLGESGAPLSPSPPHSPGSVTGRYPLSAPASPSRSVITFGSAIRDVTSSQQPLPRPSLFHDRARMSHDSVMPAEAVVSRGVASALQGLMPISPARGGQGVSPVSSREPSPGSSPEHKLPASNVNISIRKSSSTDQMKQPRALSGRDLNIRLGEVSQGQPHAIVRKPIIDKGARHTASAFDASQRPVTISGSSVPVSLRSGLRSTLEQSVAALHSHAKSKVDALQQELGDESSKVQLLQARLHDLTQAVADKDQIIKVLESQLSAARQDTAIRATAARNDEPSQVAKLQDRNAQLQEQVTEMEAQINRYRDEVSSYRRMQLEWQSRSPDVSRLVEAALAKEHVVQEDRNRKALELLLGKDKRIKEVEQQVSELTTQLQVSQQACQDVTAQLQACQNQIMDVLQSKEVLMDQAADMREQLMSQLAVCRHEIASLSEGHSSAHEARQEAEQSQAALEKALTELSSCSSELSSSQQEVRELRKQLTAAQQQVQTMKTHEEQSSSKREAELGSQVDRLQDTIRQLRQQLDQAAQQATPDLSDRFKAGSGPYDVDAGEASAQEILQPSLEQEVLALRALNDELQNELRDTQHHVVALQQQQGGALGDISGHQATSPTLHMSQHGDSQQDMYLTMELQRLRDILADKDVQLVNANAQLALAEARAEVAAGQQHTSRRAQDGTAGFSSTSMLGGAEGVTKSTDKFESKDEGEKLQLALQLSEAKLSLQLANERLAAFEAQKAAVSYSGDTATMQGLQERVASLEAQLRRVRNDAEISAATAARLNSRLTDAVASELEARTQAEAARKSQEAAQKLHDRETAALQDRIKQLLAGTDGSDNRFSGPSRSPLPLTQHHLHSRSVDAATMSWLSHTPGSSPSKFKSQAEQVHTSQLTPSREQQLQRAVADAETAVAVMQSRLLAAVQGQSDARVDLATLRVDMERQRRDLEAQVRFAQEDGSVRIRFLEQSLARLTAARPIVSSSMTSLTTETGGAAAPSGQVSAELQRLLTTTQAAVRAEARSKAQAEHLQACLDEERHRVSVLTDQLADKDKQIQGLWTYTTFGPIPGSGDGSGGTAAANIHASGPGQAAAMPTNDKQQQLLLIDTGLQQRLSSMAQELMNKQHIIGDLAGQLEVAEKQLAEAKQQVSDLRSVLPDPKAPKDAQIAELSAKLAACQGEAQVLRGDVQSKTLEADRTAAALSATRRALAAVTAKIEGQEKALAEAQHDASCRATQVHAALSSELSTLSSQLSSSKQQLQTCQQQLADRDSALTSMARQLQDLQHELQASQVSAHQALEQADKDKQELREQLEKQTRLCSDASSQAASRQSQVSLLMETLESLQAGGQHEQETQLLAVTAQLAVARSQQVALEQRCDELVRQADSRQVACAAISQQLTSCRSQLSASQQACEGLHARVKVLEQQVSQARQQAAQQGESATTMASQLSACQSRCSMLQSEIEGLRLAAKELQARHMTQMDNERHEAAENLRHARNQAALAGLRSGPGCSTTNSNPYSVAFTSRIEQAIKGLCSMVQRSVEEGQDQTGDASLQSKDKQHTLVEANRHLAAVLLDLEKLYQQAVADATVYRSEAAAAAARISVLSAALSSRTLEWQAALGQADSMKRLLDRKTEQVSSHWQRLSADLRLSLTRTLDQLDASCQCEQQAHAAAATATAQAAHVQPELTAVKAQLAVAQSEVGQLKARLAAAQLEHMAGNTAGGPDASDKGLSRDVVSYLDSLATRLTSFTDQTDKDKLMGLLRELAIQKQVCSGTISKMSAAQGRADEAQLAAQVLREAAQSASEQLLATLAQHINPSGNAEQQDRRNTSHASGEKSGVPRKQQQLSAFARLDDSFHTVADLRLQLSQATRQITTLQDRLLQAEQAASQSGSELLELQSAAAAHQLLLQHARDEAAASLLVQRQQLDAAHEGDRQLLIREMQELQARLTAVREVRDKESALAQASVAAASRAAGQEVDVAVSEALKGHVTKEAAQAAQAHAEEWRRKVEQLQTKVEALTHQLAKEKEQVLELTDMKETTSTAVASLQKVLADIESSAKQPAAQNRPSTALRQATTGGTSASARPGTAITRKNTSAGAGGASQDASQSQSQQQQHQVASLSKELVRAKLGEADAVRRLRALGRQVQDLQGKLVQRDARIHSLKDELSAAGVRAGMNMSTTRARSTSPSTRYLQQGRCKDGLFGDVATGGHMSGKGEVRSLSRLRGGGRYGGGDAMSQAISQSNTFEDEVERLRLQVQGKDVQLERLRAQVASLQAQQAAASAGMDQSRDIDAHRNMQLSMCQATLTATLATLRGLIRQLDTDALACGVFTEPTRVDNNPADARPVTKALEDAVKMLSEKVTRMINMSTAVRGSGQDAGVVMPTPGNSRLSDQGPLASLLKAAASVAPQHVSQHEVQDLKQQLARAHGTVTLLQDKLAEVTKQRDEAVQRASMIPARRTLQQDADPAINKTATGPGAPQQVGPLSSAPRIAAVLQQDVDRLLSACAHVEHLCETDTSASAQLRAGFDDLVTQLDTLRTSLDILLADLRCTAAHPIIPDKAMNTQWPDDVYAGDQQRQVRDQLHNSGDDGEGESVGRSLLSKLKTLSRSNKRVDDGDLVAGMHSPSTSEASAASSAGSALARLARGAANTTVAGSLQAGDPSPSSTNNNLLMDKVLQYKERCEKWKARARDLGSQLSTLGAGAAARDAAAAERLAAADRSLQQQAAQHQVQVARLQAALDGCEAARQELEKRIHDLASSTTTHPGQACQQQQPQRANVSGLSLCDAATHAAALAELRARCMSLERQLEVAQSQVHEAKSVHDMSDEIQRLKSLLAKEQGEKARLVDSMRHSLANVKFGAMVPTDQAGVVSRRGGERSSAPSHGISSSRAEGRLREELLQAQQAAASAQASLEVCEAVSQSRQAEVEELKMRLTAAEKAASAMAARLQSQVSLALQRLDRVSQAAVTKLDKLSEKLEGVTTGMVDKPLALLRARLDQLEDTASDLDRALLDAHVEHERDVSSMGVRSAALLAKYDRDLVELRSQMASAQEDANIQVAALQKALDQAVSKAEMLAGQLLEAERKVAEAEEGVQGDQEYLRMQHRQQITLLQARFDRDCQAIQQEADVKVSTAVAAAKEAAATAHKAIMSDIQARHEEQNRLLGLECDRLRSQLSQLEASFRSYQQQKADEIRSLEDRIVTSITGQSPDVTDAVGMSDMASNMPSPAMKSRGVTSRNKMNGTVGRSGASAILGSQGSNGHNHNRHLGDGMKIAVKQAANKRRLHPAAPAAGLQQQDDTVNADDAFPMDSDMADLLDASTADATTAVRRELLFEQLHRQRVEAALQTARKGLTAYKARLKLMERQMEAMRKEFVSASEHRKVLTEWESCKEALQASRAESSRRLKALNVLQSLSAANLLQPAQIGMTAAGMFKQQLADEAVITSDTSDTLRSLLDAALAAEGEPQRENVKSILQQAASMSSYGVIGNLNNTQAPSDTFMSHVAATAAAAASRAAASLAEESAARQVTETKLKEAQGTAARRLQTLRDMQVKVTQLEQEVKAMKESENQNKAQQARHGAFADGVASAEKMAAMESKLRQALAALQRKEVHVRELKAQLDAVTATGAEMGAAERDRCDRDARCMARLRAEVARKEVALQAAQDACEQEKQARASAETAHKQCRGMLESAQAAAVTLQERCQHLIHGLRDMLRLVLRCSDAARAKILGSSASRTCAVKPPSDSKTTVAGQGTCVSPNVSVMDVAALTSLSVSEVQDLLGDLGCTAGSCSQPARVSSQTSQVKAAVDSATFDPARMSRAEMLLDVLAAAVMPIGGATGNAGVSVVVKGDSWDPGCIGLIVDYAKQQVALVEAL